MLLTITTTHTPATDLGYLLGKNPARGQSFELPFGVAHVFWPEATEARATAALYVEVDSVGLVRDSDLSDQYVNDRPWVASSLLSVTLARVLASALHGRSKEREALAATPIPLTARVAAVAARGGPALLTRLFEPLGYVVTADQQPLSEELGPSRFHTLELSGTVTLSDLLGHLYVLLPVLDDRKHYWVGDDEVDKLLRHGEGWLATHPERELIVTRYLRHDARLTRETLARLVDGDPDAADDANEAGEEAIERPLSLDAVRRAAVITALEAAGARRIVDLGCGSGKLVAELSGRPGIIEVVGVDASVRALAQAERRLERIAERRRERVKLLHGSLGYRDARIVGFDAASLVEVIEHLEPSRLGALARALFGHARPGTVVITTPNVEYNVLFAVPTSLRHADHRFEWTRAEFHAWCASVAATYGYDVRHEGVGPLHDVHGTPTQLAVFTRCA